MKLGILTFHSQLNYGGVLQCWALKTALEGMGHDVVVVDRWLDPANAHLYAQFSLPFFKFVRLVAVSFVKTLLGRGGWKPWVRTLRTIKFVKAFPLTKYTFYNWADAPRNLGIECLIVGSDQVWHGGNWGEPEVYLLEGAPKIAAISYAASIGLHSLPEGVDYKNGFNRFAAISVREKEAGELVKSAGYLGEIKHVADPTLLVDKSVWCECFSIKARRNTRKHVVCYLLSSAKKYANIVAEKFKDANWDVELIGGSYGPREFLRAFAQADACVTNSFHAVMFSSIFDLNCRFIRPADSYNSDMFARIEEYSNDAVSGDFYATDGASAADSIISGDKMIFKRDEIEAKIAASKEWLDRQLKSIEEAANA